MKTNTIFFLIALFGFQLGHAQTYFYEDFESGGFPIGWTQSTLSTDGGWNVGLDLSSSYWPIPLRSTYIATNDDACNCDKSQDRLTTPAIDLSTVTGSALTLEFAYTYDEITYGGATENFRVETSVDGINFTLLDEVMGLGIGDWSWKFAEYDITSFIGESTLYISFIYNDGFGWEYGAGIDDVKVFTKSDYDISITSIDLGSIQPSGATSISGTLENLGLNTVTDIELNYSINGDTPVSTTQTGLSIASGDSYGYIHDIPWNATVAAAAYTVEVWVSMINGNSDEVTANDTLSASVVISDLLVERTVLSELFNSTNNPPAATTVPPYHNLINANPDNIEQITYHMFFPLSTDPFYNYYTAGVDRLSYYGISGIPATRLNGTADIYPSSLTLANINTAAAIATPIDIEISSIILSGSTIDITATASLLSPAIVSDLSLHIVVVEKSVLGNPDPSPSGQNDFYNIVRAMLPGTTGTPVSLSTAGDVVAITESYSLDFAETEVEDLRIITFIQNNTTGEVYNADGKNLFDALKCATPTGLADIILNPTEAGIKWDGSEFTNFNRVYIVESTGADTGSFTLTKSKVKLPDLTPGSSYEWTVQRFCLNGKKSILAPLEVFSMPPLHMGEFILEQRGNIIRTFVPNQDALLEIVSIDGRIIDRKTTTSGWSEFSVPSDLNGIYILRLIGQDQLVTKQAVFN